jgi:hypothetical protein
MEEEQQRTMQRIMEDCDGVVKEYMRSSLIVDTIGSYASMKLLPHVLVIFICPPVERVMKQIVSRGRLEEKVLTAGYIAYLCSRFHKATWELLEQSETKRLLEKTTTPDAQRDLLKALAAKFPL